MKLKTGTRFALLFRMEFRNRWLKLILLLSSLGQVPDFVQPALAYEKIILKRSGDSEEVEVPTTQNGSAPSVFLMGSGTFATGRAAEIAAQAPPARPRLSPEEIRRLIEAPATSSVPQKPRSIEILDSNGKLTAAMSELLPGTGIFSTARHVLQGRPVSEIEDSFDEAGLDLANYSFYEFKKGLEAQQFILAIPRGQESKIIEVATPGVQTCPCPEAPTKYRLRELPEFDRTVVNGDRYYSHQYGVVGSDVTRQVSQGVVRREGLKDFYLDLAPGNVTTPRSSGSLVYTASGASGTDWKIGGSVSCVVPAGTTAAGHPLPGGVRTVPINVLLDAEVSPVSIETLSRETRRIDPDCAPVDCRGGGGC